MECNTLYADDRKSSSTCPIQMVKHVKEQVTVGDQSSSSNNISGPSSSGIRLLPQHLIILFFFQLV